MEWTVAVGIDTHKESHVAVALDRLGRQLGAIELETTEGGYRRLLSWAERLGPCAFAIEGAGSFGAGLARFLSAQSLPVFACERPPRSERRRGKSDLRDALAAARRLLSGEGLAQPRTGEAREALRLLLLERRSAERARTAALGQLHALVVTAPSPLRERLRGLEAERLQEACARLRPGSRPEQERAYVDVLRRLGLRARALARELAEIERRLAEIVSRLAPELLEECGVGPFCAAQLLVSSGDPARMRSEASFAALAGSSPIEASSGPVKRHRLNRGGDRQLNRALHLIALTRKRYHAETAAYWAKLVAAGKTKREAMRCLKRMLARYFYRQLLAVPALAAAGG